LSETDPVLTFVEHGVVGADENISQNPQVGRRRKSQSAETERPAGVVEFGNVLTGFQGERFAADVEYDIGHGVQFVAIDNVQDARTRIFLGADQFVDTFDLGARSDQHRRSRVGDGLEFGRYRLTVDDDRVDFELPISLTSDGDVGEFADVMVGVRTAQGHLAALFTALSTAVSVHPKSENRFGAFAVLNQTSERRGDIFDRDAIVAQTHDTVEFGVDESGAGFGAAFGETLIVDANAAFFATEANFVRLDDAFHRAGAVTNGHSFRR